MRFIIWLSLAITACADRSPSVVITNQLTAAYRFAYDPPGGQAIVSERQTFVVQSPTTVPQCCFWVLRRDGVVEIDVGNSLTAPVYPADGACPPVAYAKLAARGASDGQQTIDLATAQTAVVMFYRADQADPTRPATPCPRDAVPDNSAHALAEPIALSGQIKLDTVCLDGDDTFCALSGAGSWAIQGRDQITGATVLETSGSFEADDERTSF